MCNRLKIYISYVMLLFLIGENMTIITLEIDIKRGKQRFLKSVDSFGMFNLPINDPRKIKEAQEIMKRFLESYSITLNDIPIVMNDTKKKTN